MTEIVRFARRALAIAIVGMAVTVPARAGHDDVRDDPAVVTERLNHMGFLEWRKLKWDHGYWKIEDARRANGHTYDLKLEAGTLDIVKLERENH